MFLDISPFRNIEFRRLFLSQIISMFGVQISMVSIPFQIFSLTDSTFQTGLVSFVELLCLSVTVLWGGVVADKLDRRMIIVIPEILLMPELTAEKDLLQL